MVILDKIKKRTMKESFDKKIHKEEISKEAKGEFQHVKGDLKELRKKREELFPQKNRQSRYKGESRVLLLEYLREASENVSRPLSMRSLRAWETGHSKVPRWVEKELLK